MGKEKGQEMKPNGTAMKEKAKMVIITLERDFKNNTSY